MSLFIIVALAFMLVFWARAVWVRTSVDMAGAKPVALALPDILLFLFLASFCACLGMGLSSSFRKFFPNDTTLSIFMPTILFQSTVVAAAWIFSRLDSVPFTLFGKLKKEYIADGFFFFLSAAPFVLLVGLEIVSIYFAFTGEYPERQEVVGLIGELEGWRLATALVSVLLLAPISEELLFRKILYGMAKNVLENFGFRRTAKILLGGALVSVLFSAVHANLFAAVPLFCVGMFLVLCYEKSGSIFAPITLHALFNSANVLLLFIGNELAG